MEEMRQRIDRADTEREISETIQVRQDPIYTYILHGHH
jgi:hypothetical protein